MAEDTKKYWPKDGETLCAIAAHYGFKDCTVLRNNADNAKLLEELKKRRVSALKEGDRVVIPLNEQKVVGGKNTQVIHKYKRFGIPVPSIRFVRGSKHGPCRSDASLKCLHVSNYVTNQGGVSGTSTFPNVWGFDADCHADPDAFKVEVVDPGAPAGAAPIKITLQALKPLYEQDPAGAIRIKRDNTPKKKKIYDQFAATDADWNRRKITVDCDQVSPSDAVRFRSRYLRLVLDDKDFQTLTPNPNDGTGRALLVTDLADGNGDATGNDWLEILDQRIEATYGVQGCNAPTHKCEVVAQVPISPGKRRIALCVHIFRKTVGGLAVGGAADAVTIKDIRRRIWRWFRRAYAPPGFTPMLVDPKIEIIDPPRQDAIVIGDGDGKTAAGVDGVGNPSRLRVTLGAPPPALPFPDATFDAPLVMNQTPYDVGNAVVNAVPADFTATRHKNPAAMYCQHGSCDVIFKRADGQAVVVKAASTTDTRLAVGVVTVNVDAVPANATAVPGANVEVPHNPETRRLIRSVVKPAEDRLDCFVIGEWDPDRVRGRAWLPYLNLAKKHRPQKPLRYAVIMAQDSHDGKVLDGSDNLPFTFPHEAGHVLLDVFHTSDWVGGAKIEYGPGGNQELMSTGTSPANAVDATKRICDSVKRSYGRYSANHNFITTAISAVARLRKRGKPMFRPW